MILERVNYLLRDYKDRLRVPGDDRSLDPPLENAPDPPKLLQMSLAFKKPALAKPSTKKKQAYPCLPGEYVMLRLRMRTLRIPPLRPEARWIWAMTGYLSTATREKMKAKRAPEVKG